MITFARVALGAGGGVHCSKCHGPAEPASFRAAAAVIAEIESAVAAWSDPPGPNIALGGPEPFDHPELPSLVAAAIRAHVRRLRLETDGAALRSAGNAAGSVSAGVRHISFVLLGGTPGMHDALHGEPGAFEAALEGVRVFRQAAESQGTAVSVAAVVPACRHNLRDLPAAVGAAVEAGVDAVRIRMEDGGADLAGALPWLRAACDTGVVNAVWVEVEGVPFCLLPDYELHCADVVRDRTGAKSPVCASCALDDVCGGGPAGASADIIGLLHPPAGAARLWRGVSRARGEARTDA